MWTIDRAYGSIRIINQTRLPEVEVVLSRGAVGELAEAISPRR